MRKGRNSIVANPVLVGASAILVAVVAVFLAYQANQGLPFVPTYRFTVDLPNGQNLVPQNEVREGGARIGLVESMRPVRFADGRVGAQATVALGGSVSHLPIDSRWAVRPRSALAQKYLEVVRGRARKAVPEAGHVARGQVHNPVELDDFLDTFDARTRRGSQELIRGTSDALAGRGADINDSLAILPSFLSHLEPVARILGDPSTRLRNLFQQLDTTARIVAPLTDVYARSFANAATTFAAIGRDPAAFDRSFVLTPPALEAGARSLRVQRPFLRDLTLFSEELERSSRQVRLAVPPLTRSLALGARVQLESVALSRRTGSALQALDDLATSPQTSTALRALAATLVSLRPQLRYLGPRFTVCNYWNFFWTFNADHISDRDSTGTVERVLSNSGDQQANSVSTQGAAARANGEGVQPGGVPQFFHGQPYGRAVDEQGNADCEDGQRGYPNGPLAKGLGPRDRQRFQHEVSDPRTPGNQGPTYRKLVDGHGVGLNPSHVPAGETFDAEPSTGPRLP